MEGQPNILPIDPEKKVEIPPVLTGDPAPVATPEAPAPTRMEEHPAPTQMKEHPAPSRADLNPEASHAASSEAFPTASAIPGFSPDNRSFFAKMSEGAKDMIDKAYEGLHEVPGVNMVLGKMEIAYDQFWLGRHEEKAAGLRDRMSALDMKSRALDVPKKELQSVIADLQEQNVPGFSSLQLKLKDIDAQKMKLANEKDRIQTRFEARENKVKHYANERDGIADKLIGYYGEKLAPMEKGLESLSTDRDQLDLSFAVMEARHNQQLESLNDLGEKKTKIERSLKMTGMSDRQISKFEAVKILDGMIVQGRASIKKERAKMSEKKTEIEEKIAAAEAKANPYRDRREEFTRVKSGRPIKMHVGPRTRVENFTGHEEVDIRTRGEAVSADAGREPEEEESEDEGLPEVGSDKEAEKGVKEGDLVQWRNSGSDQWTSPKKIKSLSDDGEFAFFEGSKTGIYVDQLVKVESQKAEGVSVKKEKAPVMSGSVEKAKTPEAGRERFKASTLVSNWNKSIKENYGKAGQSRLINSNDFMKATKLSGDYKLGLKDFGNIIAKYYKLNKVPFNRLSDAFAMFEKKLKAEKK
jgi:hypothetical protein